MLSFGAKMPFSYDEFLRLCENNVDEKERVLLSEITLDVVYPYEHIRLPALRKWHSFDIALRNELVRIRANRLQRDANAFLKEDGYTDPSIARVALHAYRSPSLRDAERILDEERWARLSEFSLGHYFDIEFLVLYALKLRILERWGRIDAADPQGQLQAAIAKEV